MNDHSEILARPDVVPSDFEVGKDWASQVMVVWHSLAVVESVCTLDT